MAESSWHPDRVVYVASGDRRVTAGMIEELLSARDRTTPTVPRRRRSAARLAEQEAIAARPKGNLVPRSATPKGLVAGQGHAPPVPPAPARRPGPDPRIAALELERDDLELERDVLIAMTRDLRRLGDALAAEVECTAPSSSALADWRARIPT